MIIKVLKSKNDQLCKGDESKWFFRKCLALLVPCPFFHPSSSRDLIFRPMSRGNSSFKLVSQDEPISYTTIREAFRKDLRSVGVDSSTFGFYSLRSRGATSAAYNGVSDSVFQWLGRWKSVLAKDVYRWWPRKKAFSFLGSRSFHLSFRPILCHSTYFVGLVLAKPSQNKLICHYVLSVDVV